MNNETSKSSKPTRRQPRRGPVERIAPQPLLGLTQQAELQPLLGPVQRVAPALARAVPRRRPKSCWKSVRRAAQKPIFRVLRPGLNPQPLLEPVQQAEPQSLLGLTQQVKTEPVQQVKTEPVQQVKTEPVLEPIQQAEPQSLFGNPSKHGGQATGTVSVVILGAGRGTRMPSSCPKICHLLGGRPLWAHSVFATSFLKPAEIVLVVAPGSGFESADFTPLRTTVQHRPTGTGPALMAGLGALKDAADFVLVMPGDVPLVRPRTIKNMVLALSQNPDIAAVCLAFCAFEGEGHGCARVMGDGSCIYDIVDFVDTNPTLLQQNPHCFSGIMLMRSHLVTLLDQLTPHPVTEECHLTDIVKLAHQEGQRCVPFFTDSSECWGVDTFRDLGLCESVYQACLRESALRAGAKLVDLNSVYLCYDTTYSSDVTIHPHVVFGPGVHLAPGAVIHSFSYLENTTVGAGASVGPFAHLHGETKLGPRSCVGNFVECKNTIFGPEARAKHLSYLGDAVLGSKVNIGAGTIACNYDGCKKYKTDIGDHAFIGGGSTLVAPLSVGQNSFVAAGSVITESVPDEHRAFGRAHQVNKKKKN